MNDIKLTKLAKCAGCGAKVGAGTLKELLGDIQTHIDPNLLVGFDKSDDAAVYKINDDTAIVQTVDFFPPIVDDPFTFGQIAAANALSDVYAMGGEPRLALNLLCVPQDMPKDAVHAILAGGYSKAYEAGAIICGGHSIYDEEPKYGLSVTGFVHPDRMLTNSGAKAGDVLILTKPLGIGIITTAHKAGAAPKSAFERVIELMCTLNKAARDCMVRFAVHACTDVTGFGLLGHLGEMAVGADVTAIIETQNIRFIEGALDLAREGMLPGGMYRNRGFIEQEVDETGIEKAFADALYDPQTSGGLLIAVDPNDADELFNALSGCVPCAQRLGRIIEKQDKRILLR